MDLNNAKLTGHFFSRAGIERQFQVPESVQEFLQ
jgi:hypothetical protein